MLGLIAFSCHNVDSEKAVEFNTPNRVENSIAKGFSIAIEEGGYVLNVFNPWQEAKGVNYSYLLTSNDSILSNSDFTEVINIPVSRVVCLSTTHIAFIDKLGSTESIVGISGSNFISNPLVRKGIERSLVKDVGFEQSINYELLVDLKPDVVFTYGVGAEMAGYLLKLKDLGIPVVFIGEYVEENPLGKAEWLKVFGLFFDQKEVADSLFINIEKEYNSTANQLVGVKNKPNVFINLPWKDIWYFPGGDGYMAKLIHDAGGNYALSNLKGSKSFPYSIESAIEIGMNADIWINTGSANSLNDILSDHSILRDLPVLKNGYIYNNNRLVNEFGGNDFWESGVVNPHIVLKDLSKILHPDLINHNLVYYQQLR